MTFIRSLAVTGALFLLMIPQGFAKIIPSRDRINGFAVGCQAYTFKDFTAFDAIEKTAKAGGKIIEFYPDQPLSMDMVEVKMNNTLNKNQIAMLKAKLFQNKVLAVNYGVVTAHGEDDWRKIFQFAKELGLYAITTESVDELDTLERLAKQFNIHVAIHDHARRDDDPNYKLWDPKYVLSLVRGRSPLIGACADTGHWQTSGLDPLECVKILRGRIISCHLKDHSQMGPGGHCVPFGTGVGKIKEILDELKAHDFEGNISIEYEYNWKDNVPEVKQCIDFIRNY